MANKKSTTKSKTKTTKRTTNKKSAAAKSANKKTQVKDTATDKAKTPKKSLRVINFARLKSLHLMSVGLFLLLALAAGYFMSDHSYQLIISYLAADTIADKVAPASRALFDLEIRWYLVGLLVISAVLPLLYLTKLSNKYEKLVTKSRYVPWRWLDFAVIGGLLMELLALLSGIQNLYLLKLIAGFVVVSAIFGWMAERGDVVAAKKKTAYKASLFTATVPWIVIVVAAVSSVLYGGAFAPVYVYALYFVVALGYLTAYRIQYKELNTGTRVKNYMEVERSYLMNSIATRAFAAAILIFGLLA